LGWCDGEFPTNGDEVVAAPEMLEAVKQSAIAFCPASKATVVRTWSGLRPRLKDVQRQ